MICFNMLDDFALMFDHQDFSIEAFAYHNSLSKKQYQNLQQNEQAICEDLRRHFGELMSFELNKNYLAGSLEENNWQKGCYSGAKIINSLVESGYRLNTLTVMPTETIVQAFDALSKKEN